MSAARKRREQATKVVDEIAMLRCAVGHGIVREEVWKNAAGEVIRYNLAFINHEMFSGDNGRVLGYDTAHGEAHRHFYGRAEAIGQVNYDVVLDRFLAEVRDLRVTRDV